MLNIHLIEIFINIFNFYYTETKYTNLLLKSIKEQTYG